MPTFLTEPQWYDKNGVLRTSNSVYTEISKENFLEIYNKVLNGERVCYFRKDTSGNGVEYIMTAVSAGEYNPMAGYGKTITFCDTMFGDDGRYGEPCFKTYYFQNDEIKKVETTFVDLYMQYACPKGCLSFQKIGEGTTLDGVYKWEDITWNIGGTDYHVYKRIQ